MQKMSCTCVIYSRNVASIVESDVDPACPVHGSLSQDSEPIQRSIRINVPASVLALQKKPPSIVTKEYVHEFLRT